MRVRGDESEKEMRVDTHTGGGRVYSTKLTVNEVDARRQEEEEHVSVILDRRERERGLLTIK